MGFSLANFVRLRPYLFHLTSSRNLDRLGRTMRMDCAAQLLVDAGRPEVVRSKRRHSEMVQVRGDVVHIRDQAPLHAGNTALSGGWLIEDFIQCLNQKVFFWPGTSRGPIAYGIRHYERYREEAPVILRIPTVSMFAANDGHPPLFCRFNSGSPRCSYGQPSPRSPETFQPAVQAAFGAARVVEVVFDFSAVLPGDAEVGLSPSGPWAQLR